MRVAGADPPAVYSAAQREGLDSVAIIRLLRRVFLLSVQEAVAVLAVVERATAEKLAGSLVRDRGGSVAPSAGLVANLHAGDFQSMDQFPLSWRWTDPKWNELPPERLSRILPLTDSKAKEFSERGLAFFHALKLRRDLFSQISEHDDNASVDRSAARPWLKGLPVSEDHRVLVLWGRDTAALADWATFCDYWDDFCYPMSDVIVWPSTEEWGLHYRRDERFVFGVLA